MKTMSAAGMAAVALFTFAGPAPAMSRPLTNAGAPTPPAAHHAGKHHAHKHHASPSAPSRKTHGRRHSAT